MTTEIDWIAVAEHTDVQIEKMINNAFEEIGLTPTVQSITVASNEFLSNDIGFSAKGSHPDGFDVLVGADFEKSGELGGDICCYSEKEELWGEPIDFEGCGWVGLFDLVQEEVAAYSAYKKALMK